jgi:acyl-CoA synthetase (NDP forming)
VALEKELQRRARAYGIRLLGPNCMGVHTPIGGVSWLEDADPQPGRVAMLSQSGANASEVVMRASPRALRFSYVASYGNALDLNECDLLEYLADDPDTDVVLAYLEGIKDGRRFVALARRLAARKPFVVLKGGVTDAGSRAAVSHTGSLAGSAAVWQAVARQTGLIDVTHNDQLIDLAVTSQRLSLVAGPRAALVGRGGGHSVLAADAIGRAGLELPSLGAGTQERLAEFLSPAGNSIRNPVDSDVPWNSDDFLPALRVVAEDPQIDVVILQVNVDNLPTGGSASDDGFEQGLRDRLLEVRASIEVPLAIVLRPPRTAAGLDLGLRLQRQLGDAGVAVYDSVDACAGALRRYLDWRLKRPESAVPGLDQG